MGFPPLAAFADHGAAGNGEPLAMLLRPGNAGSNTAADHLGVLRAALRQLPGHRPGMRPGPWVLVRADAAGGTHALLDWLSGQRLSYSVGFALLAHFAETLSRTPAEASTPAYDAAGSPREGASVAE